MGMDAAGVNRRPSSGPREECHREGAVFATAAILAELAQIATLLRGSQ
ncbi:MAG: hypothetical protein ACYC11_13495 [Bellilinea sp.]